MKLSQASYSVCLLTLALFAARIQSAPALKAIQQQQSPVALAHEKAIANDGARVFATNCSGCHGADARGGERAPDIASRREVVSLTDDDLETVIRNGKTGLGMPPFEFLGDTSIRSLVAHLRVLQGKDQTAKITGNVAIGKTVFFGKGRCSQCHMLKGEGGFIGADLTDYAQGKSAEDIFAVIVKPDAVLSPTSELVEVTLSSGEYLSGLVRAEDNFAMTLQAVDGRWSTLDKANIAHERHTGRSLHPRDFDTSLTRVELEDVVSYLMTSAADAPAKPARRKR